MNFKFKQGFQNHNLGLLAYRLKTKYKIKRDLITTQMKLIIISYFKNSTVSIKISLRSCII